MNSFPGFILVIGASAGSNQALADLVKQLQTGTGMAGFVVLHLPEKNKALVKLLQRHLHSAGPQRSSIP